MTLSRHLRAARLTVFALALCALGCSVNRYGTRPGPGDKLKKYTTFELQAPPKGQTPDLEGRIRSEVVQNLAGKGYFEVAIEPEMLVRYSLQGSGEAAVLSLDMVDFRSGEVVWSARGSTGSGPALLQNAVAELLHGFPIHEPNT